MADGTPVNREHSRLVGGKTSAPGAGASLATITTPPQGYYRLEAWYGLSGTLAAVDASNVEVRVGTTVLASLAGNAAGTFGPFTYYRFLDGNTTVTMNATAASTAGSVYHATLIITKLDA